MNINNQYKGLVTLINVYTVQLERQEELLNFIHKFSEQTVKSIPGFLSATLHKGLDGTHITNVAHWENQEALLSFIHSSEAREGIEKSQEIAQKINYHLYTAEARFTPATPSHLI